MTHTLTIHVQHVYFQMEKSFMWIKVAIMIQSVILQKKTLGANHMKTFSWIPKDSNTGENKDSTINPLFFLWLFFIVSIILRLSVMVDSNHLVIGRTKLICIYILEYYINLLWKQITPLLSTKWNEVCFNQKSTCRSRNTLIQDTF